MTKVLGLLSALLLIIIGIIVLTGGALLKLGSFKAAFISLDAFAIALMVFILILLKLGTLEQTKFWNWLSNFQDFVLKKSTAKNFLRIFLFLMGSIFLVHLFRHWSLNTHSLDMSMVNQSLFYPFGEPLLKCDLCRHGTRFGSHIGLTLFLIAPFTSFLKSSEFIIFIQLFFVSLSVYFLTTRGPLKGRSELWIYAFLILFAHKGFRYGLVWDFKEDHLGEAFLFASLLCLYLKKEIFFYICILGVLASKEHTSFMVPLLSIPIWFEQGLGYSKKERLRLIIILCSLCLAWAILVFGFFLPRYAHKETGKSEMIARLGLEGGTTREILIQLFFSPKIWWKLFSERVLNPEAIKYTFLLYVSFAYFTWRKWWWLVATTAGLAINLVSTFVTMRSFKFHYEVFIFPTLFFGLLMALREIDTKAKKRFLTIGLVVMLIPGGDSPVYQLRKFLPTWGQIRDIGFYYSLPNDGAYLARQAVIPQVTNMKNIATFEYDRVPFGEAPTAKYVLLRPTDAKTAEFISYLEAIGYRELKTSPSGMLLLKNGAR